VGDLNASAAGRRVETRRSPAAAAASKHRRIQWLVEYRRLKTRSGIFYLNNFWIFF
jgi:hypothetical protein